MSNSTTSPQQRRSDSYAAREGCTIKVSLTSGDVRVRVRDGEGVELTLVATHDDAFESVETEFSDVTNTLSVRQDWRHGGKRSGLFGRHHECPDVELVVPATAHLEITTASGDVLVTGRVASLTVKTASGDVRADADRVEVASASGDVVCERVNSIRVASASGSVRAGLVSGDAKVNTVSGDIDLAYGGDGGATVTTVSGDVRLGIQRGRLVDLNVNSRTGEIHSSLDPAGETTDGEVPSPVKVSTLSGDVHLVSA